MNVRNLLIRNLIILGFSSVLTLLTWLMTWLLSQGGDETGAQAAIIIAVLVSSVPAVSMVIQVGLLTWFVLRQASENPCEDHH